MSSGHLRPWIRHALSRGQLTQLVDRHRKQRGSGRFRRVVAAGYVRVRHRFERGVGRCPINSLGTTSDQALSHALGKDVVEQALEDRR